MPNYLTVAEAQEQLPALSKNLRDPAIITQDGKPVIVALSMKQFASLVETMEILSDREFMADLREGIRQADLGQMVSLEVLKLELDEEGHVKLTPKSLFGPENRFSIISAIATGNVCLFFFKKKIKQLSFLIVLSFQALLEKFIQRLML